MSLVSLIVSAYNEEAGLPQFYEEVRRVAGELEAGDSGLSFEFLFVDDGSRDGTAELLYGLQKDDSRIRVIRFSRNFGHEAAMTAGLDHAAGDILIFMDADLQHPPACIPQILDKFREGYEVVSMVRTRNEDAGLIKKITSAGYYAVMQHLSTASMEPGASDFFAISLQAAEVLRAGYREKLRFLRGYVQNVGFRKTVLTYEAGKRVAGSSHYSIGRLWRLSMDSIVCFSEKPLRIGFYAAFLSFAAALILLICGLASASVGALAAIIVMLFLFSLLFFILGVLGEYMAGMLVQLRDRPIYIIRDIR